MNHHFEYTLRTYDINIFELQFKTLITRRNKEYIKKDMSKVYLILNDFIS